MEIIMYRAVLIIIISVAFSLNFGHAEIFQQEIDKISNNFSSENFTDLIFGNNTSSKNRLEFAEKLLNSSNKEEISDLFNSTNLIHNEFVNNDLNSSIENSILNSNNSNEIFETTKNIINNNFSHKATEKFTEPVSSITATVESDANYSISDINLINPVINNSKINSIGKIDVKNIITSTLSPPRTTVNYLQNVSPSNSHVTTLDTFKSTKMENDDLQENIPQESMSQEFNTVQDTTLNNTQEILFTTSPYLRSQASTTVQEATLNPKQEITTTTSYSRSQYSTDVQHTMTVTPYPRSQESNIVQDTTLNTLQESITTTPYPRSQELTTVKYTTPSTSQETLTTTPYPRSQKSTTIQDTSLNTSQETSSTTLYPRSQTTVQDPTLNTVVQENTSKTSYSHLNHFFAADKRLKYLIKISSNSKYSLKTLHGPSSPDNPTESTTKDAKINEPKIISTVPTKSIESRDEATTTELLSKNETEFEELYFPSFEENSDFSITTVSSEPYTTTADLFPNKNSSRSVFDMETDYPDMQIFSTNDPTLAMNKTESIGNFDDKNQKSILSLKSEIKSLIRKFPSFFENRTKLEKLDDLPEGTFFLNNRTIIIINDEKSLSDKEMRLTTKRTPITDFKSNTTIDNSSIVQNDAIYVDEIIKTNFTTRNPSLNIFLRTTTTDGVLKIKMTPKLVFEEDDVQNDDPTLQLLPLPPTNTATDGVLKITEDISNIEPPEIKDSIRAVHEGKSGGPGPCIKKLNYTAVTGYFSELPDEVELISNDTNIPEYKRFLKSNSSPKLPLITPTEVMMGDESIQIFLDNSSSREKTTLNAFKSTKIENDDLQKNLPQESMSQELNTVPDTTQEEIPQSSTTVEDATLNPEQEITTTTPYSRSQDSINVQHTMIGTTTTLYPRSQESTTIQDTTLNTSQETSTTTLYPRSQESTTIQDTTLNTSQETSTTTTPYRRSQESTTTVLEKNFLNNKTKIPINLDRNMENYSNNSTTNNINNKNDLNRIFSNFKNLSRTPLPREITIVLPTESSHENDIYKPDEFPNITLKVSHVIVPRESKKSQISNFGSNITSTVYFFEKINATKNNISYHLSHKSQIINNINITNDETSSSSSLGNKGYNFLNPNDENYKNLTSEYGKLISTTFGNEENVGKVNIDVINNNTMVYNSDMEFSTTASGIEDAGEDYYVDYTDFNTINNSTTNSTSAAAVDDSIFPDPDVAIGNKETTTESELELVGMTISDDSAILDNNDLHDHDVIDSVMYIYFGNQTQGQRGAGRQIIIIGAVIALVAQFLTLASSVRRIRLHKGEEPTMILLNIEISLTVANLVFILGVQATSNFELCRSIAVILYYFHVATMFWFVLSSIHALQCLGQNVYTIKLRTYCILGWTAPVILVIAEYILNYRSYEMESYCWISPHRGVLFSYILPVLWQCVIIMAVVIFGLRDHYIVDDKEDNEEEYSPIKILRINAIALPLFAVVWFTGIVSLENSTSLLFSLIFLVSDTILNWLLFACWLPSEASQWRDIEEDYYEDDEEFEEESTISKMPKPDDDLLLLSEMYECSSTQGQAYNLKIEPISIISSPS